jgi:hypothetical protein
VKSITELSRILDVNLYALSKLLSKNNIFILEQFEGNNPDGFIEDEIYNMIVEKTSNIIDSAFSKETIINNKSILVPMKMSSYIYFLLVGDNIVYIGQTNQILDRIQQHMFSDKSFDYVSIFEVDRKKLNEVEQLYIYLFNPYLNKCKYDKISIIDSILKNYN